MKEYCYFLGSSVTYGFATNGVSFVEMIGKEHQIDVIKEAVSGTTLMDNGDQSYLSRFLKTVDINKSYKAFIIQFSTNDSHDDIPNGDVSAEFEYSYDTKTTFGSLETILSFIKTNFSQSKVLIYTNFPFENEKYKQMVAKLDTLTEKWNVQIIDFYHYKDMKILSKDELPRMMADPIHPNLEGYKYMADIISKYIF